MRSFAEWSALRRREGASFFSVRAARTARLFVVVPVVQHAGGPCIGRRVLVAGRIRDGFVEVYLRGNILVERRGRRSHGARVRALAGLRRRRLRGHVEVRRRPALVVGELIGTRRELIGTRRLRPRRFHGGLGELIGTRRLRRRRPHDGLATRRARASMRKRGESRRGARAHRRGSAGWRRGASARAHR